ncbi:MAG TPA: ArsO family NAD(P)H-dependent flavin-containing monooxygenase [Fulvivirga sp.]|nr:ArsO family NAD(P)H-dependent flavin-containing monooxygenase [Fulvivirga sp.]
MESNNHYDAIIIGGGQSGLAVGYYMRRTKLNYLILDDQDEAGGAWLHTWDSLQLFSPAEHSSLPGWLMPKDVSEYPSKQHVIGYLQEYETRYKLPIKRPVRVKEVTKENNLYTVKTDKDSYTCSALINTTGSWKSSFIPKYPNQEEFNGQQIHSAHYKNTTGLEGKNVLIVGGGNSGAQILAEVSKVAQTTWVTLTEPKFLPDEVDGRYLFEFATKKYKARLEGKEIKPAGSLGDVVMVAPVKEARSRNVLGSKRPFASFYKEGVVWPSGEKEGFDVVIWCTGFKAALHHLDKLNIGNAQGKIETELTKAKAIEGLWLVGYGSWTGYASATLIGVGRTARRTAEEVRLYLKGC